MWTGLRGVYERTERGREVLTDRQEGIHAEYLERFPEFRAFQTRTNSAADGPKQIDAARGTASLPQVKSPEEALEDAYLQFRAALEAELLEAVTGASPADR